MCFKMKSTLKSNRYHISKHQQVNQASCVKVRLEWKLVKFIYFYLYF
jgi:hypothetical protein